jgi:hypothetical protein
VIILASIAVCSRYFASYPGVTARSLNLRKFATKRYMWRDTKISGFRRIYEGDRASEYAARGATMILESLYRSIFALLVSSFADTINEPNAYA